LGKKFFSRENTENTNKSELWRRLKENSEKSPKTIKKKFLANFRSLIGKFFFEKVQKIQKTEEIWRKLGRCCRSANSKKVRTLDKENKKSGKEVFLVVEQCFILNFQILEEKIFH